MPRFPVRRGLWLAFGYLLAAASIGFSIRQVGASLDGAKETIGAIPAWVWPSGICLFALHALLNATGFSRMHNREGEAGLQPVLRLAWLASLPAKYLPGGLWHWVGRGALLAPLGVSPARTTLIGLLEQGVSLAICCGVAACLLLLNEASNLSVAFALLLAMLLVSIIWLRYRSVASPSQRAGVASQLARGMPYYALAMVPFALGYICFVLPQDVERFLLALFGGTVAGMLAIPVPGGLGVRELVAVNGVSADVADTVLMQLSAARLAIIVSEFLLSLLGGVLYRRTRQS